MKQFLRERYFFFISSFFLVGSTLTCIKASAQVYGNEWINYSQRYLKIHVAQDGIYRIDSTTLSNAMSATGVPLGSVDPRNFQVFHNGEEQYIWVQGEQDGVFNNGDFIEFFGRRNDGSADSVLYHGANNQLNPYFSLFNDTTIYFLTWNSSVNNLRLQNPNDTVFTSYTPSSYFLDKEIFNGYYTYFPGVQDALGISDPDFIPSEGWYDIPFDYGGSVTHALNTRNVFTGGPDSAKIAVKVGSHSDDWNTFLDNEIKIQYPGGNLDTTYNGYYVKQYNFSVQPSLLGNPSSNITVSSINPGGSVSSGRTAVAFITITYPHNFDMEGRNIFYGFLPDDPNQSKSFLNVTNVNGAGTVRVYDLFNHLRIDGINNSGTWQSLVPNGNGTSKPFVVTRESDAVMVTSLTAVNGNGMFVNYTATPMDSAFVIVAHPRLWSVATDYKNYRQSAAGGSHHVVLANIDDLYEQFGWGVRKDPLAIRRFADYLIHTFPTPPQNLFLMGKSLYCDISRINPYYDMCLVPTMGTPPSDNSITAGLNNTTWEPAIPTGRIAAKDSAAAQWYLNKVMQYESNSPEEWMKYVLHFGGGTDAAEQSVFKSYLMGDSIIISDTLFGAHVQSYYKTSSAPIQINLSDSLRQRIDAGVSIMTFFGHADGTGFDQSIDDPSTYSNSPHYPFLIANSCYAGDIHSLQVSSSEAFTLLDNKGVIGYLGSVDLGIAGQLNDYTSRLYTAIGKKMYGKSIGKCIQWTVHAIDTTSFFQNLYYKTTCMTMTLQGDPSIVINSFPKPDYEITNADVWYDKVSIPDSVKVFANVKNIGRAINDSIVVQLLRKFPNGDTTTYLKKIRAPKFSDTLCFTIPVDQQRGIGLNKISVDVNHFHLVINELTFANNMTTDIDMLLYGKSIIPVYPYDYAVIPTDTITLKASTVNALEPARVYRFELDTTDLYNSPFRQIFTVTAPGGVVSWKPNLLPNDSAVYFWRVTPDSLTAADHFEWRESSFQYITGKTGWGQAHIFQFKNDGYVYAKLNRPMRRFDFVNDVKTVSVKNGIVGSALPWNEIWYKINGATEQIWTCVFSCGCSNGGVTIAVIDPVSGQPWHFDSYAGMQPDGNWDCVGPGQPLYAYDFPDGDSLQRSYITHFIDSVIPNGYYVLAYSQYYHSAQQYENSLRTAFGSIGGMNILANNVADTTAFIVWGRKGYPSTFQEAEAPNQSTIVTLQDTFSTKWNSGYVASTKIGPAANWGSLTWKQHPSENPTYDSLDVQLYGTDVNGNSSLLHTYHTDSTTDLQLGWINAAQYPYLQLKMNMQDDTSRTPPQIDRWHVLYSPVPDLAVNPPLAFSFLSDTLQEGQDGKLVVGIQNISPWAMTDSLLFTYWLVDHNRNTHNLPQKVRGPVPFNGYAWFPDTLNFSTTNYPGANELWMEVNPVGHPHSQYEQQHFNNFLMVPFNVSTDKINPLLDVTFDGVHIMNDDLVSGKPDILITLKDENQFLALNDTSDFKVFLKTPSQQSAQLMPWGPNMIFTPAVLPHNSCKILFNPQLLDDGKYELIVQAKDRSNNRSGYQDYDITFEVINHPSVTNVLNYPNPFSTSTRFVFTLTGDEVPQIFTIQIMTITGKVVREIDKNELGNIHIGRNITDYAWDGRDDYGDQLANGVYLYRVITRLDGNGMDHRDSGADPYITRGWGKMYLMR